MVKAMKEWLDLSFQPIIHLGPPLTFVAQPRAYFVSLNLFILYQLLL